jgi:hypothetical protein
MMRDVAADVDHFLDRQLHQLLPTVCAALFPATFSDRARVDARDSHEWPLNHDYCDSLGRYASAILFVNNLDDRFQR